MASFMTISVEARTSVYEYLLSDVILSPRPVSRRTRNASKTEVGPYPAHLNLFLVNKQIYSETNRILLGFFTVRLRSRDQLQVLARQPLIANLIIDEKFNGETAMLTNTAATISIRALAHLKNITFELERVCRIEQTLEDASVRPLTPPHPELVHNDRHDPSLIYYYSLWYYHPVRKLSSEGKQIMDRLSSMVSAGSNVIFSFPQVHFRKSHFGIHVVRGSHVADVVTDKTLVFGYVPRLDEHA